jgi:hypothetical protein
MITNLDIVIGVVVGTVIVVVDMWAQFMTVDIVVVADTPRDMMMRATIRDDVLKIGMLLMIMVMAMKMIILKGKIVMGSRLIIKIMIADEEEMIATLVVAAITRNVLVDVMMNMMKNHTMMRLMEIFVAMEKKRMLIITEGEEEMMTIIGL